MCRVPLHVGLGVGTAGWDGQTLRHLPHPSCLTAKTPSRRPGTPSSPSALTTMASAPWLSTTASQLCSPLLRTARSSSGTCRRQSRPRSEGSSPGWRAGWGSLGMGVQGDPGSSACPQECCARRGAHPRLPGSQVGKHPCPHGSLPLARSLPSWGPGQTAGQPKAPGPRGPLHTLHPLLAPCGLPVPAAGSRHSL